MLNDKELFEHNEKMLEKICLTIRNRVRQVLRGMENDNCRPMIHADVWRSPEDQLDKYRRGVSKLKFGFHCFINSDGSPASLAADIVDADQLWFADEKWKRSEADERFWFYLGKHALKQGLNWGGLWFNGTASERMERQKKLITDISNGYFYNGQDFGWDVAHVETPFMTVEEAYEIYKDFTGK